MQRRTVKTAVDIDFERGERRRYRSLLHRADGVVVAFEGGSYNRIGGRPGELPHDLAHLIVEAELGLERGVWGVLAAGGLFAHATIVSGRQKPHAARRGRELVVAAREDVMHAELLTRAVCDLDAGVDGTPVPADADRAAVDRAHVRLRAGATAWAALRPGETLRERWP